MINTTSTLDSNIKAAQQNQEQTQPEIMEKPTKRIEQRELTLSQTHQHFTPEISRYKI